MSYPEEGESCGYGLRVHLHSARDARIVRESPHGEVIIERADIEDVISALRSVLDQSGGRA